MPGCIFSESQFFALFDSASSFCFRDILAALKFRAVSTHFSR
ncbi:hypothetical protein APHMUC_0440 [Anaplasma phagocytophilum str. ApMUC09]|uniref:Uncharacterized protein n=1 Tax=Anaplasma phagocytophilum str. ApMUC09 TaxID=1359152 RepID=A0A0F3NBK3_ANAPH|nr:hypothetical protein APHMUC_0440 [Anaplasma phagocytophilum str. ApMUC09]